MKTAKFFARASTFVAVPILGVSASQAQPIAGSGASVEWEAANSCVIVRGIIDDVAEHALPDGLHGHAGIHRYETVAVQVLETLKGMPLERLQFVEDGDWGSHHLADLQKNKQEVLLFLEPWARSSRFERATGGYAYTLFPYVVKSALILNQKSPQWNSTSVPVLSNGLALLSTPSQVLDTLRSCLKNHVEHAPLRTVTTKLPPSLRGGYYETTFRSTVSSEAAAQADAQRPILKFDQFKDSFATKVPHDKKPPYLRNRGGYIGVQALELMAADCDAIVRGVIDDECFVKRIDDPTGDQYGVRFRVNEKIRGATGQEITCFISDARDLQELRRAKQEIVLFLRSNRDQAAPAPEGALEYRLRSSLWHDSVIVLTNDAAEALFADLSWHRDPDAILGRLRTVSELASRPLDEKNFPRCDADSKPPVFYVHLPPNLLTGASIAGNQYAMVALPVNQELEDNARKWATSPDQNRRWLAARAMIYFKSDKNAALLKTLLDDASTWDRREMLFMTGLAYPYEPDFLVRWEAWHVLAGWGYKPPEVAFTKKASPR